jgi:hypothetical protein
MSGAAVVESTLISITCQERNALKRVIPLEVPANATIQEVRTALSTHVKHKIAGILMFDGDYYLQNHITLDAYEISDGATLFFECRMCGPLPLNHDWSKSGLPPKPVKETRFAF